MRTITQLRPLAPLAKSLQDNAAEARNDAVQSRIAANASDEVAATATEQAIAVESAIELLEEVGLL